MNAQVHRSFASLKMTVHFYVVDFWDTTPGPHLTLLGFANQTDVWSSLRQAVLPKYPLPAEYNRARWAD